MPTQIKATISLEIDGQPLAGYPIVKTLTVDELQSFNYEKVAGGHVALPVGELGNIQFLIVRPNVAVEVRLDGQTDAGIEIAAGGILLIAGATMSGATLSNAADAVTKGIAGGT